MVSSDVYGEKFQQFCYEFVTCFLHDAKTFHKDAIKEEKMKANGIGFVLTFNLPMT